MMDCEKAKLLLSARLDGELRSEEAPALEAHLASCAACREFSQALDPQDAALRRAFSPRRAASAAVAERVISQISPQARSSPRWFSLSLAAAAGFLGAMLIFRPWDQASGYSESKPSAVHLALATGLVEVLPPGNSVWQALATGGGIEMGSRVRTGDQVRCEFSSMDGSELRLNHNTEIAFEAARKFELAKGQIWTHVAADPSPFEVKLAEAKVVALGTQFDILRLGNESVLTVFQGATKVEGKGEERIVKTGEKATIVGGRVSETTPVRDLLIAARWVNELLMLKGRDNEELARRVDDMLARLGQTKMSFLYEEDIRAMGDHCVLPLTRFIQSPRSETDAAQRVNAARILSDIAQPWSIPDLISLLTDRGGDVRYFAAKGLERITGQRFEGSPEEWRDRSVDVCRSGAATWQSWWEKRKDQFPKAPMSNSSRNLK